MEYEILDYQGQSKIYVPEIFYVLRFQEQWKILWKLWFSVAQTRAKKICFSSWIYMRNRKLCCEYEIEIENCCVGILNNFASSRKLFQSDFEPHKKCQLKIWFGLSICNFWWSDYLSGISLSINFDVKYFCGILLRNLEQHDDSFPPLVSRHLVFVTSKAKFQHAFGKIWKLFLHQPNTH